MKVASDQCFHLCTFAVFHRNAVAKYVPDKGHGSLSIPRLFQGPIYTSAPSNQEQPYHLGPFTLTSAQPQLLLRLTKLQPLIIVSYLPVPVRGHSLEAS